MFHIGIWIQTFIRFFTRKTNFKLGIIIKRRRGVLAIGTFTRLDYRPIGMLSLSTNLLQLPPYFSHLASAFTRYQTSTCPVLNQRPIFIGHNLRDYPSPATRVSSNQLNFFFGSNRNKPKLICFGCFLVCFAKPKNIFFGLFRCFGPVSKQLKQNFIETNQNKPKKLQKTFSMSGSSNP